VPRTIRLDIAYDGTEFVGWQRQENGVSVQQVVEEALAAACDAPRIAVDGASRTDSGVHALGQTASARIESRLDDETLVNAINSRLPRSVSVRRVSTVGDRFHARFSARGKHYAYRILHAARPEPIGRAYLAWTRFEPAIPPMREAARALVGRHDFASFATAGSPRASSVREIWGIHVLRRGAVTTFAFRGNGFLYNQVRAMVGTLLLVGQGKLAPARVGEILAARDRRLAGPTAPPEGLFLLRVLYGVGEGARSPEDSQEIDD
jgi:tRNA pseudouridine38-40 synthase